MKKQSVVVGALLLSAVCRGADYEPSSRLATEELTNYIQKVTGRAPAFRYRVGTLGTMDDVPAEVRTKLAAMEPYESSWTAFRDGTLWIVGKEETAELYAVYHFLEEKLGVRWFKSPVEGDDGEYLPDVRDFVPEPFEEYRKPDYIWRTLCATGVFNNYVPEKGMATAVRNGFQIHPMRQMDLYHPAKEGHCQYRAFFPPRCHRSVSSAGGGHCLFSEPLKKTYGSIEKAFAAHPEYFAQVGGKRVRNRYPQFCISNPDFVRFVADYYIRVFGDYGGVGILNFCAEDVQEGWCECEKCLAMDNVDNRGKAILEVSTRYAKCIKRVSDAIWKAHPKATLVYMAYSNFVYPPEGVVFDRRMKVQYCITNRCYGHELDDASCDRNVSRLGTFRGWVKMGVEMMTYEYLTCTKNFYVPTEHVEAHDIRYMFENLNTRGWNNEASFSDSHWIDWGGNKDHTDGMNKFPSNWQWLQVAGHALWDVNLDVDAFLADRESKYYGAAYSAMKDYHALRRKLWRENGNHMGYPMGDQRRPTLLLVDGAKEKLLASLDAAEKLVANDPKRLSRVKLDRFWLDRYWIRPCDTIRERMKHPLFAKAVAKDVTIDGVADEPCWREACETDNFRLKTLTPSFGAVKMPSAEELAKIRMTAKVMRDDEALYFFVDLCNPEKGYPGYRLMTKHDDPVWGDHEAVELFIFPPTDENKYIQVAVNALGTVFDAKHPPCDSSYDAGVTAAAKMKPEGGVTMEIRIPVSRLCGFRPGDNWRMAMVRDLKMQKPILPPHFFQALGGISHNDTSNYWPLEIK